MNRICVVDFNGYIRKNRSLGVSEFIIKEFSLCDISDNGPEIILKEPIVTRHEDADDLFTMDKSKNYEFLYATRIKYNKGSHDVSELKNSIIRMLSETTTFYVENDRKRKLLQSFISQKSDKIKSLSSFTNFDFQPKEPLRICSFHHSLKNQNIHCAYFRTIALADYAYENYFKLKPYEHKKTYVALVDLNGYKNPNGKFYLKELSVKIINSNGEVTYDKLFVIKLLRSHIGDFYSTYYEKYGIPWDAGDHRLYYVLKELNDLIDEYKENLKVIFVRNRTIYKIFSQLIVDPLPTSVKIVYLDKINYKDPQVVARNCGHHIEDYLKISEEKCAGTHTDNILSWILEKEYHDYNKFRYETLIDFDKSTSKSSNYLSIFNH